MAATPGAGHLNPLLAVAHMATARGDRVTIATADRFQRSVEAVGADFVPLLPGADFAASADESVMRERASLPAGPAQLRFDFERFFLDTMPAQLETLRAGIERERPDLVVTDCGFMGRAALFLDTTRPDVPLVSCGISILPLDRPDGAPFGLGLPPARDGAERAHHAELGAGGDEMLSRPIRAYADAKLAGLGLPSLPCSVLQAWASLADVYLQTTVPAFEYDYGVLPPNIRFVGPLPPPPLRSTPRPHWWGDLDGGRRVVLVTQGTIANGDFGELVEPTLAALARRDDLLVVVTTGGRPVEDVRGPIPANARLATFLDYAALLPKTDVLVTNGGYGTVSMALREGVPIVAAGRTEDKAEVGARVAWSGVGIEIPSQRPAVDDLRASIEAVLSSPAYRVRARAMASDMAGIDTRAEILGVLDRFASVVPRSP